MAEEKTRTLTVRQLIRKGAHPVAIAAFVEVANGDSAQVSQAWALQMAAKLPGHWAYGFAVRLLPRDWVMSFRMCRVRYDRRETNDELWARISWAVFAALYVHAGDD